VGCLGWTWLVLVLCLMFPLSCAGHLLFSLTAFLFIFVLLCPRMDVKYCDQCVCMFVCLSVCLHISISNSTQFSAHAICGRGLVFFDNNAIFRVLPVLRMTFMFSRNRAGKGDANGAGRIRYCRGEVCYLRLLVFIWVYWYAASIDIQEYISYWFSQFHWLLYV